MDGGFILLHRRFLGWGWYDDISTCRLFIHLLLKANWEDKEWHGVIIGRGQVLTSRLKLSQETGLSQQTIKTSLNHLKSTNEITIQSTKLYSIITICKYDIYQAENFIDNQVINQQTNQQLTNHQPSINQASTTTKQRNKETIKQIEEKEEKEDIYKYISQKEIEKETPASLTLAPPQEGATPKKTIKEMQKDMEQRLQTFMDSIRPFVEIYGRDMCNEFYAYWSEPNKSKTKFRAENEKTWDIGRRLERWSKNNFKTISNGQQSTNNTRQTTGVAAAQEQLARIHQRYTAQ